MGGLRNILIILCELCVAYALNNNYVYKTMYFKQKVDHFGYSNTDVYSERYLIADQYWNHKGGPIFFYTGNEGDITSFANNTGLMWEQAPKFKALLIFAEHRYYGLSQPYGNKSLKSSQYRGYLTTEQALADFANLIYYLKSSIPGAANSPVIAFGGSYGGMLAAWMRMKYPHIINGALASSAPVLQFTGITPCNKFSNIVTKDFQKEGVQCAKSIRRSWEAIRTLGSTGAGAHWLSLNFHLCEELSPTNISTLVDWLISTWGFLAMTDYPYPADFLVPLPANPIKETCKYLTDASQRGKPLLLSIYKAVSVFQNYTGSIKCFNLSQSGGSSLGEDGWDYQSCTEIVMPMCSDGVNDMFEPSPWNITSFAEWCNKTWNVTPEPFKPIVMYGGRNISAASNIIFSNGDLDPWSAGGIQKSLTPSLIAIKIQNAAHHLDLRESNPADPSSVIKARNLEIKIISKWIRESQSGSEVDPREKKLKSVKYSN